MTTIQQLSRNEGYSIVGAGDTPGAGTPVPVMVATEQDPLDRLPSKLHDLYDRVIAEDSDYQAALASIDALDQKTRAAGMRRNELSDSLADCVNEKDQRRVWGEMTDCFMQAEIAQSMIRAARRALPEIAHQACERRLAAESAKRDELRAKFEEIRIDPDDPLIARIEEIAYSDAALAVLHARLNRSQAAERDYQLSEQFCLRLEQVIKSCWGDSA